MFCGWSVIKTGHRAEINLDTCLAGETHFRQRHRQATFAHVMRGEDNASFDKLMITVVALQ